MLHKQELLSLIEMWKLMESTLDHDALLNTIIQMSAKILRVEGASIILPSEDGKELTFCIATGDKSDTLKKIRLKAGEGVVGWVISKQKPAIVNNVHSDSRFSPRVDELTGFQTRNILCIPIKIKGKVIGALEVVNKHNNDFDLYDLKICEAIATQSGVAIEKSRLIEENIRSARLATIGETVVGLAHCVRNILNGLKSGEYLVEHGMEKRDQTALTQGWNMVKKNISRISALVLDMLAFSKDHEPKFAEVSPNNLIKEAVDLLQLQANEAGVKLKTKLDKNLKKAVLDSKDIYRCLINLIGNGIDACSEGGGEVCIESRLDSDDYFTIMVRDTGCGMDKTVLNNLFKRFFTTKPSKGTGLGLPVAQKIIKEHCGSIKVASQPGQGTTFTIRLPRLQPQDKVLT
jgi:signal transduction histidine kinase